MGLRDRLRARVEHTLARLSGEYSAGESSIRTPSEAPSMPTGAPAGDVKITRPRLRRPREAGDAEPSNGG